MEKELGERILKYFLWPGGGYIIALGKEKSTLLFRQSALMLFNCFCY